MILIHSSELYSTMIAPFAVAIIVLCGISKMRRSIFAYGLLLYTAAVVNGIVYSFGTDVNLLGLQRLKYSIYSKYPQQNVICPIITTGHIAWDGAAFILSSRSLGRRLESSLFQQGVTKGGFRACVYAGVGSEAGSATEMIFLGIDIPRFLRISPRLSEIFVR
jgi:hypothetical protein